MLITSSRRMNQPKQIAQPQLVPPLHMIADYRNCRYQGSIDPITSKPFGRGMMLDEHFLFAVGQWVEGQPSGRNFVVFPNSHLFYGDLRGGQPGKLCIYRQPAKYSIYLKSFISGDIVIVIDDHKTHSLLVGLLTKTNWQRFHQLSSDSAQVLSELLNVVGHKVYLNEEDKWKIVSHYWKEPIPNEFKSYEQFVADCLSKDNCVPFVSRNQNGQYNVSYQGSSIVCKIQKNIHSQGQYTVKMLGIYDEEEEKFILYKKYKQNGKVQQFIEGLTPVNYTERSKKCLKKVRDFYKRSVSFLNSYVSTHSLGKIQHVFTNITEAIDYFLRHKYAEKFLYNEDTTFSLEDNKIKNQNHSNLQKQKNLKQISYSILKHQKNKIQNKQQASTQKIDQNREEKPKIKQKKCHNKLMQKYQWLVTEEKSQKQNQNLFSFLKASDISQSQIQFGQKKQEKLSTLKELQLFNNQDKSYHHIRKVKLKELTEDLKRIQDQIRKSRILNTSKSPKMSNRSINPSNISPSSKANQSNQPFFPKYTKADSQISSTSPNCAKSHKRYWR